MINLLIPLAKFFDSNLGFFARKVLAALGLGVISYTAISTGFNALVSYTRTQYDGIAPDILALMGLGGIGQALGIIVGAMTFKIAFLAVQKMGVIPK